MLVGCGAPLPIAAAGESTDRIVSIDYCADQMVLGLVDRNRIAAVSDEIDADPLFAGRLGAGLPRARPEIESIIALRPSLVVRSYAGGPRLDAALTRAGIAIFTLPYANTLNDVRVSVRVSADALNARSAGARRLGQFDQDISAPMPGRRVTALYTTPGDYTAGGSTLIDEAMRASGLTNAEQRNGWHRLQTERLVSNPPTLVIRAFGEAAVHRTDRWSGSDHAALARAFAPARQIDIPGSWVACGNWRIGHAVAAMRASAHD